jgi:5-methylcytosine-specific restriction protein A
MSGGPVDHAAAAYPSWLGRFAVPFTAVIGPAGNGARGWVADRAGPDDQVLDLAEILTELSGLPAHRAGDWIVPALERRNTTLRRLTRPCADTPAAWLITPAPAKWQRVFWTARGATVTLVDPGLETALIGARDECVEERHVHRWYQDANYGQPTRGGFARRGTPTAVPAATTASRGYGRDHGKLRDEQLAREPHCRFCWEERSQKVRAVALDHIEPFRDAEGKFDGKKWGDPANHRSLCAPCHNARGATRSRAEKPPGAGADGRPLDPAHPWNRK